MLCNVDVYTNHLVKSTESELSQERKYLVATTVGKHSLFRGEGCFDDKMFGISFDIYAENLVRSAPTELSIAISYITATKLEN